MADKISTYGRAGLDISQARSREVNRADRAADAEGGRKPDAGRDAVDFSSTATMLKGVEVRLQGQPEVDEARVNELRQKIESGNYELSPERLAAKLLRLEQDLG